MKAGSELHGSGKIVSEVQCLARQFSRACDFGGYFSYSECVHACGFPKVKLRQSKATVSEGECVWKSATFVAQPSTLDMAYNL